MAKDVEAKSPAHITGVCTNEYKRDPRPFYTRNGTVRRPEGRR